MASRLRRRAENVRSWIRNNVTHRADVDDVDDVDGPEPDMPYLSYPPIKLDALETSDTLSPFFGRLPFEIRRRILVYAFGDQTVHMHLRLECIPRRRPYKWELTPVLMAQFNTTRPHGGLTADMNHGWLWTGRVLAKSDVARGGPRGRRWQWWGCVCHRSMPSGRIGEVENLWNDKCLLGEADYCDLYGPIEMHPQRCMIGCMGWLLASRQAYAEGIDVVYATNTICIMSNRFLDALLRSVPQLAPPAPSLTLVPPSHFARITRLELAWEWALFQDQYLQDQDPALAPWQAAQAAQRAAFQETLALLPAAFPRVVALYVSFSQKLYQPTSMRAGACLDEIQDVLLAPLEAMMSKLSRLQRHRCFVDLPINTSLVFVERLGCYNDPEMRLLGPQARPPYTAIRCWWDPSQNQSGQNGQSGHEANDAGEMEGTKIKDAEDAQGKQQTGFWITLGTHFPITDDEKARLWRLQMNEAIGGVAHRWTDGDGRVSSKKLLQGQLVGRRDNVTRIGYMGDDVRTTSTISISTDRWEEKMDKWTYGFTSHQLMQLGAIPACTGLGVGEGTAMAAPAPTLGFQATKSEREKVPKMAGITSQSSSPETWYHAVQPAVVSEATPDEGFVDTVGGIVHADTVVDTGSEAVASDPWAESTNGLGKYLEGSSGSWTESASNYSEPKACERSIVDPQTVSKLFYLVFFGQIPPKIVCFSPDCDTVDATPPTNSINRVQRKTYHAGTPDEHEMVVQLGQGVAAFNKSQRLDSLSRIINGCDQKVGGSSNGVVHQRRQLGIR